MITEFKKYVTYLGNDDNAIYTFPFKIRSVKEIVVVCIDTASVPNPTLWVERGDTLLNIAEVTFDAIVGGGTIRLPKNLEGGKRIYIKLAPDEPTQQVLLREQQDFKLRSIETALDYVVSQVQRLAEKHDRRMGFADNYSHVDDVTNLEIDTSPVAHGMPIMDNQALQLQMKPFLTILAEQGTQAQIDQAIADAAQASADAAAALVSANNAEASAAAAEADAQAAADSAAAAIGASVSNRIQVTPYAPSFMGAIVEEEYGQEVFKFGLENKILMFVKMSQYMIAGRPIKLGFSGYSPTADNTSKHKFQITFTLIREGLPVTDTTYQDSIIAERNLINIVDNFTSFNLQLTSDGTIVGEDVQPEDAISIEIKRVDASSDEDPELVRLHKQTFELSFA